ncbi:RHS repeat-associated core domain-containing protein [Cellulomonas soli]|uniref:RHS repeat-associated core domain-containing protein n=1 Tax=Cellulomonas soli TaxID=931535 RepID=UPI003F85305C
MRDGQLSALTDWADRVFDYDWTDDGQVARLAYPNGVTTSYDHDAAGQVAGISTESATGIDLLELAYSYTDAGLLTDQTTTRSTEARAPPTQPTTTSSYTWDPQARLAQITGALAGTFAYDEAGSVTELSGGRTLTYDAARQVTSLIDATANTQTAYGYDARGNRTTADTTGTDGTASTRAVFDLANRLTTWTGADGTSTTYTYAATGLRASATTTTGEQTSTEQYVWDSQAAVPLLLSDASFAYVYGLGTAPLEQVQTDDGTVDFLHTDLIGSVRSTTDATGQVTSDTDYDAYGRPQPVTDTATATITRFGYAGEYTDPTGLTYLRARYYDPQSAQFLSVDPLVDATTEPYSYAVANPLQLTDPTGLASALRTDSGGPSGSRSSSCGDSYSVGPFGSAFGQMFTGGAAGVTSADAMRFGVSFHSETASQAARNLANWRWYGEGAISSSAASRSGAALSTYSRPGYASTMNAVGRSGLVGAASSTISVAGVAVSGYQAYNDSVSSGEESGMAYARASAAVASSATGVMAGMAAGAWVGGAVGSVVPGLGTIVGFVAGAVVGAAIAWAANSILVAGQNKIYY